MSPHGLGSTPPEPAPFDHGEFDALAQRSDIAKQKQLIGRWLDDREAGPAFWRMVEQRGGLEVGDWKFIADPSEVVRILQDDEHFRVSEYARRMRAGSGRFYLGMDGDDHTRDAAMGAIIPSWNPPPEPVKPNLESSSIKWLRLPHSKPRADAERTAQQQMIAPTSVPSWDPRLECAGPRSEPPAAQCVRRQAGQVASGRSQQAAQSRAADDALVSHVAQAASQAVLVALGRRTRLARLTNPDAACQCSFAEILGPVLDASAAISFGVSGPSAYSLLSWGNDIAQYNFRVQADEANRSRARQASTLYRAHVLDLIARLDEPEHEHDSLERGLSEGPHGDVQRAALRRSVERLREHLAEQGESSDDDVARNLIGIVTGSLAATAKAFGEGLASYARSATGSAGSIVWPEPAPTSEFGLYERVIAASLAHERRGSLDAVYRSYTGEPCPSQAITVCNGDTVIVWLGGSLQESLERQFPDRLFGIGVHRCPGMDMGKAIMQGILQTLARLRGLNSARLTRVDGDPGLAFGSPAALEALAAQ